MGFNSGFKGLKQSEERDSSVTAVTSPRVGHPRIRGSIPARVRNLTTVQFVQTVCGTRPGFWVPGDPFVLDNAAGV